MLKQITIELIDKLKKEIKKKDNKEVLNKYIIEPLFSHVNQKLSRFILIMAILYIIILVLIIFILFMLLNTNKNISLDIIS